MKEKITIHRALSELKLIDSKIEKQIMEIEPVGVYQKGKPVNGFIKEEDFVSSVTGKYQSISDLIARKSKIKSAIVKANGETKVKVAEIEMTIADAINFKTAVRYKKLLADKLKARQQAVVADMNRGNGKIEENLQRILEATFGKENVKTDKNDIESVSKPYLESNLFHLLDPLEVTKKIEALEKEVAEFLAEVDAVLSEINAITFIEV